MHFVSPAVVCRVGMLLFFVYGIAAGVNAANEAPAPDWRETIEKLLVENAAFRRQNRELNEAVLNLTESLAIARTESDLFQKKWLETRLLLELTGSGSAETSAMALRQQLTAALRALRLAEAERDRLASQLERLMNAVQLHDNVQQELERTRDWLAESNRTNRMEVTSKAGIDETLPTLTGARVADVNAALQLVVLNVGQQHGARVGMPFVVMHADRVISELRVVEVRRRISGAVIVTNKSGVRIQAGDAVRATTD